MPTSPHTANARAKSEPLQLAELVLVLREEERLAGEDDRGDDQAPPPRPKTTKPGRTKISVSQADAAGDEERHFQPARRAFQKLAPEEEREGDDRDEGADAGARRVQLDIDAQRADEDQHGHHFLRPRK